jgi:AcrR family transcriptional regulator
MSRQRVSINHMICMSMSRGWDDRQVRTRADVLAAVGDIVARDGLDGLTMRKLAEQAGVAVATLYNQFSDRGGVLVAFVTNGLDQLERELDEQPAAGPIDTTRAMFAGLDQTIGAATEVWRPVLAAVKSGPGVDSMGAVGDRIVTSIENDLAKADADGMFIADCDTGLLANHLFTSRMRILERWANGRIDWNQYRLKSDLSVELSLAAVLADPYREQAVRRAGIIR